MEKEPYGAIYGEPITESESESDEVFEPEASKKAEKVAEVSPLKAAPKKAFANTPAVYSPRTSRKEVVSKWSKLTARAKLAERGGDCLRKDGRVVETKLPHLECPEKLPKLQRPALELNEGVRELQAQSMQTRKSLENKTIEPTTQKAFGNSPAVYTPKASRKVATKWSKLAVKAKLDKREVDRSNQEKTVQECESSPEKVLKIGAETPTKAFETTTEATNPKTSKKVALKWTKLAVKAKLQGKGVELGKDDRQLLPSPLEPTKAPLVGQESKLLRRLKRLEGAMEP